MASVTVTDLDRPSAADAARDALDQPVRAGRPVVDDDALANSVERFREQGIALPTFAELADPATIDPALDGRRRPARPRRPQPVAGALVQRPRRRAGSPCPTTSCCRATLTGVDSPIIVVFGDRFPMITAHKVLAAYACLAPRIVTGQFDPTRHRAIWPSHRQLRPRRHRHQPHHGAAAAWRSCPRG